MATRGITLATFFFRSPYVLMLLMKFGWSRPVVTEEMLFENVNRHRTDGKTDGRTLDGRWTTDGDQSQKLILSICSGELNMFNCKRFLAENTFWLLFTI